MPDFESFGRHFEAKCPVLRPHLLLVATQMRLQAISRKSLRALADIGGKIPNSLTISAPCGSQTQNYTCQICKLFGRFQSFSIVWRWDVFFVFAGIICQGFVECQMALSRVPRTCADLCNCGRFSPLSQACRAQLCTLERLQRDFRERYRLALIGASSQTAGDESCPPRISLASSTVSSVSTKAQFVWNLRVTLLVVEMSFFWCRDLLIFFLASRSFLGIENLYSVVLHRHCLLFGIELSLWGR